MTNRSHRPVCNLLHPSALCFARPLARLGAQERNSSWLKANALSEVEYTEAVVPRFRGRLFHWQNGRSPYTDAIRGLSCGFPGLHPGYGRHNEKGDSSSRPFSDSRRRSRAPRRMLRGWRRRSPRLRPEAGLLHFASRAGPAGRAQRLTVRPAGSTRPASAACS